MKPSLYYDTPADVYHAGMGHPMSLSSSLLSMLTRQSPAHAFAHCPGGGGLEWEPDEKLELGTAVHAYVLEGVEVFEVVEHHDWRKKEAQAQRDEIRSRGLIPVLAPKMDRIRTMAAAIRKQIGAFSETPRPLSDGRPEVSMLWPEVTEHGSIMCRARIDWLRNDGTFLEDLKTCGGSVEPNGWIRRQLFPMSYHLQVAMYLRGYGALTGKRAGWRFVCAEVEPPHLVSVIGLSPAALAHADDVVEQGIQRWAKCIADGSFPGYPTRTAYADVPAYEIAAWTERMEADEEAG